MNRKQLLLTLLLAVISGFLGGAVSVWFLMPPSVLAQSPNQDIVVGKITARAITLLDEDGNERISIFPGSIVMLDPQRNMHFWVNENDMGASLYLMPEVGAKHGVTILVRDAASVGGPAAMMWINEVNGESVWSAP